MIDVVDCTHSDFDIDIQTKVQTAKSHARGYHG